MSTKKLIATLLAVVMAVGVLAGCGNDFGSNETAAPASDTAIAPAATVEAAEGLDTENTYKVGVLMPLSGDLSFFSAYFQPILDIYQADINANGGINGHALELVYKDTQGDATITAQRLDEMTDEKVTALWAAIQQGEVQESNALRNLYRRMQLYESSGHELVLKCVNGGLTAVLTFRRRENNASIADRR